MYRINCQLKWTEHYRLITANDLKNDFVIMLDKCENIHTPETV